MRKYALCLLVGFFFLCLLCPLTALSFSQTGKGAVKHKQETASNTSKNPARNGWVHIEEGVRPAYVGIQGGTAPVSLMKGSDGVLFAFTGKTGNDFTMALKGQSIRAPSTLGTNASAPIEKTDLTPQKAPKPSGGHIGAADKPSAIQITELNSLATTKKDNLIFADPSLSTRLTETPDEFVPFGLSQADTIYNLTPEVAKAQLFTQVKPLRLRGYGEN